VSEKRKQTHPHPMRLTILKDKYPDVYDEIVSVNVEQAIQRGRLDKTCYIGHGGLSNKDLKELVADADGCQQTLCETCQAPAEEVAASVRRRQEEAREALETVQITLGDEDKAVSRRQETEYLTDDSGDGDDSRGSQHTLGEATQTD